MYFSHLWQPVVLSAFAFVGRWHPWCCLQHVRLTIRPWYCYPFGCYWRKPAAVFSNFVSPLNPLISGITDFWLKIVRSVDTFITTFFCCVWLRCCAGWVACLSLCVAAVGFLLLLFFFLAWPCYETVLRGFFGLRFTFCFLRGFLSAGATAWWYPPSMVPPYGGATARWLHHRWAHRRWTNILTGGSRFPPFVINL